ncbi:MAG TPA: M50 family metallopeptidase [Candidatus Saccharimonadales bacterium]|nr:M50 family metallopeptidase [Candidatus Saccharimonadales bacterium]
MPTFLFILGILLFICLILIHEFGHFIIARRNGVEVEEFGLGFPPRIWAKKMRSGFKFSINYIPLGGFVKLKGEYDSDQAKGGYGVSSIGTKVKIMLAGVVMNVLAAYVILTVLAFVGLPQLINNQFTVKSNTRVIKSSVLAGSVESKSPASSIGLKSEDQLISISSHGKTYRITDANKLPSITKSFAGQQVTVVYEESSNIRSASVQLRTSAVVDKSQNSKNPIGYLGIDPVNLTLSRSTWSAPIVAAGLLKQITVLTFKGLGNAIAGLFQGNTTKASSQVSGPVGIVEILKNSTVLGYQFVLVIVALISLSLAIFNVLPLPPLDGGKLFYSLVARIFTRHAVKKSTEDALNAIGVVFILILFVLITIVDIHRIF